MKPSIRNRLVALLVASAVATSALVALAIGVNVRDEVDELLDDTLQASAEVLGRLLAQGDARALRDAMVPPLAPQGEERFAWQLVGRGGELLLRSPRAPEEPLLPLATSGFADAASGWRVYGLPLPGGERTLYVAQTRSERREAESEVAGAAVFAALGVGVLAAAWLATRVRRELGPLADLAQALSRYEPLRPDSALPEAARRELQPVHDAIEALGQRLARRVANERAFSSHAAHALRTPLAGIEAQLAVALREAPPELRPRLARVREGSARLARVVAALLAMFRSGPEPRWQDIGLRAVLDRLPHEGLAIEVRGDDRLRADADLLVAGLLNLVDNAVRHGARRLTLAVTREAGSIQRLHLQDDGPGVSAARRAELDEALRNQDYEGRMGLGLMLTDLVARAHGGALTLPETGAGFALDLRLGPGPVDPSDDEHA